MFFVKWACSRIWFILRFARIHDAMFIVRFARVHEVKFCTNVLFHQFFSIGFFFNSTGLNTTELIYHGICDVCFMWQLFFEGFWLDIVYFIFFNVWFISPIIVLVYFRQQSISTSVCFFVRSVDRKMWSNVIVCTNPRIDICLKWKLARTCCSENNSGNK